MWMESENAESDPGNRVTPQSAHLSLPFYDIWISWLAAASIRDTIHHNQILLQYLSIFTEKQRKIIPTNTCQIISEING